MGAPFTTSGLRGDTRKSLPERLTRTKLFLLGTMWEKGEMPFPYDALIFDLDGTLWNSTVPVTRAWNETAHQLGQGSVTPEAIQGIMGLPHDECFKKIFPQATDAERKQIEQACTQREMVVLQEEGGVLYPGVLAGLDRLKAKYPLFVVSNCDTDYLKIFLAQNGMQERIRDAECYGNTGESKADNLRRVVERNRLKSAAYVGDTAGDHIAATRAGLDYYHVTYGFGDPASDDCLTFDSFDEVCDFFLEE